MKIVSLQAENLKRLAVVEIEPDGRIVQITGRNGSGKSSVLDAIYYALAGGKALPAKPVRKGAETARIRLDLGEIVVTRRFTAAGGTSLVVEQASGARYPSPQRMLDDLVGAISFDPLAFARMDARDQFETLRGLVKIEVDLDALAGLNARDYDSRTDLNRQAKQLRAQAAAIIVAADLPTAALDTAPLVSKLRSAGSTNAEIEQERQRRERTEGQIKARADAAAAKRARAVALREEAAALDVEAKGLEDGADDLQRALDTEPPLNRLIDTEALVAELEQARAVNAKIEQRARRQKIEADAAAVEAQAAQLTANIEERERQRADAIAAAKMPVEGLTLGDGAVLYRDLPFEQASSAEQLRVSVAIAMAGNPKLRVLRIKDGSLLDEDGLRLLRAMADADDYQVWIERVDASGRVGIVMEDGAVKAVHAEPVAEAGPDAGREAPARQPELAV